jgi:predicted dehydrogenase
LAKNISIAVVALGGYGMVYLQGLLDEPQDENFTLVAGIDPYPEHCDRLDELKKMNIPIYDSLDAFYEQGGEADLVILSSPIQLHLDHTRIALEHGSHVLCEKPLGATVDEADDMIAARDKYGRFVAIGYQWSFTDPIQDLKRDIQKGVLGAPVRLKTMAFWPRDESYYNRNSWAGKVKDKNGRWILDSPVNNAVAHYLHNMFFVLGDQISSSVRPKSVEGELYRVKPIESYDTAALRVMTENDIELLFYATHSNEEMMGPVITYEFEKATVTFKDLHSDLKVEFKDGREKSYGKPDEQQIKKMWDCIRCVRTGEAVVCPPEAAKSQTVTINALHESFGEIVDLPESMVKRKGKEGETLYYSPELESVLRQCHDENKLPSELGVEWSKAGKQVNVSDYHSFKGI